MIELPTTLTAATVFPDRARVTRAGRLTVQPGVQKLALTQLPLALLPDSVRASGQGAARAKLLGVSTRLENFVETPSATARDLEQMILVTEDQEADRVAQVGVLEKEQKHLDGLAAQSEMYARGLALRDRKPEELTALFGFISERSRALQADMLRLTRERRDLAQERDRLKRELQQTQSARPKQRYVATVEVDVLTAGELDIELTYVVQNAHWQPLYDLRLVERDSNLEMTYLAQVAQNTGEDWSDVSLTLSTAQPALALLIPELDPWYIHPRTPPVVMQAARAKSAGPMLAMPAAAPAHFAAQAMAEPESVSYDLAVDSATISESGASLTYHLPARADIPGNNDPRKVTIGVVNLRPDLDYVTAPKHEQVCYRRATIKNDSPYTLLPGPAQLFEGAEYLGATQLEFVAPNQKFELALGADERLRVERELVAREVDKAFMLGDRKRIRYAYTIKLENLRDTPQVAFVRDQLPVSRDEQIKVKLDSADPKATDHSDLNQLEWKLTLDKGAKQTIRFDFNVEFPKALDVIGLP